MACPKTLFQTDVHNLLPSSRPNSLNYLKQRSTFQQPSIHKQMAKQKEPTKPWNNISDAQWTINKTIGPICYIQQSLLTTTPFMLLLDKHHSLQTMATIQEWMQVLPYNLLFQLQKILPTIFKKSKRFSKKHLKKPKEITRNLQIRKDKSIQSSSLVTKFD